MLLVLKHVLMCANDILLSIAHVSFYLQPHLLTLRQSLRQDIQFRLLALASCTYLASCTCLASSNT